MFFNANLYGNLPNSYLFHMQVKQQPNQGQANQFVVDTMPPITENYIRNGQHKKQLQDRRNRLNNERSGSLHEMLLRLNRGRQEVGSLQSQLDRVHDNPFQKRILEAQLGHKSAGTSFIEHSLASSYDPGASGFLGSENRIDTIGSFVTSA